MAASDGEGWCKCNGKNAGNLPLAPLQCNHRNLARGIPLVLAVLWVHLRPASLDAVALLTGHWGSDGVIRLVPPPHGHFMLANHMSLPLSLALSPPYAD